MHKFLIISVAQFLFLFISLSLLLIHIPFKGTISPGDKPMARKLKFLHYNISRYKDFHNIVVYDNEMGLMDNFLKAPCKNWHKWQNIFYKHIKSKKSTLWCLNTSWRGWLLCTSLHKKFPMVCRSWNKWLKHNWTRPRNIILVVPIGKKQKKYGNTKTSHSWINMDGGQYD